MPSSIIDIPLNSGETMPAYLARPADDNPRGGIVLLQEIFGINANMRAIADDYASRGYMAIAPDLFWRQEKGVELDPAKAEDRDRATELMKGMDQNLAVDDALASAAYLREMASDDLNVGAVGYCLGGKLAFMLSTKDGIDAAVSYYGVAIQSVLDKAPEIKAPLLLHIAMDDHLCPPEAQQAIHDALGHCQNVTIIDYPGVGHAFARKGGASFDQAAAQKADAATTEFFDSELSAAA